MKLDIPVGCNGTAEAVPFLQDRVFTQTLKPRNYLPSIRNPSGEPTKQLIQHGLHAPG